MEGELVEGCPILRLSDSAEDVRHLLKVLYDRRWAHNSFASFQQCNRQKHVQVL